MLRDAIRYLGPVRPLAKRSIRFLFPHYSWLFDRLNWEARLRATVNQFPSAVKLECREDLYRYVSGTVLKGPNAAIDYLEFGVYQGGSIRQWSSLNQNSASRLFGFDSFEGLPEDWHSGMRKGTFSTGGKIPEIADPRVSFISGWFQKSLRGFLGTYHPRNRIVIHVDCDLFSSTLYCLTTLDLVISPGTLIILDDFFDALHVYRALSDYCSAYLRQYELLACTRELGQAAIVML
jgi:O-methyltransferase